MANSKTVVWQHAYHALSSNLGFVTLSKADADTLVAANVAQRPKIGAYRFKKLNKTATITSGIGVAGSPFIEGGTFTYTITHTAAATEDTTYLIKMSGTAVEGADYEEMPYQVTVPAGALTETFDIVTINRGGVQGSRTVICGISTYEGQVTIAGALATFTLIDA